tara:strand:+ start:137 stop:367 length:231 start_codon:yes stop_codon:yes gene_type:complete
MTDFPWSIGDNDIHSKGIKAWSDRQQTSAELASSSAVRRAASAKLFNEYVTQQIRETLEYNAFYDAVTSSELDLLA